MTKAAKPQPDHACIGPGCTFCLAARELGVSKPGDAPAPSQENQVKAAMHRGLAMEVDPTPKDGQRRIRYITTIQTCEVLERWDDSSNQWEEVGSGQTLEMAQLGQDSYVYAIQDHHKIVSYAFEVARS